MYKQRSRTTAIVSYRKLLLHELLVKAAQYTHELQQVQSYYTMLAKYQLTPATAETCSSSISSSSGDSGSSTDSALCARLASKQHVLLILHAATIYLSAFCRRSSAFLLSRSSLPCLISRLSSSFARAPAVS
jgi:hypothetical protein